MFFRKSVTNAVLALNLNNAHLGRVQSNQTYPKWFSCSLIIVSHELVTAELLQSWIMCYVSRHSVLRTNGMRAVLAKR